MFYVFLFVITVLACTVIVLCGILMFFEITEAVGKRKARRKIIKGKDFLIEKIIEGEYHSEGVTYPFIYGKGKDKS